MLCIDILYIVLLGASIHMLSYKRCSVLCFIFAEEEVDAAGNLIRSLSSVALQSPKNGGGPSADVVLPGLSRPPVIDELPKSGDCTPVNTFRKRRLTMADSKPIAGTDSVSFPKRASIFSSTEIGVAAETLAPFTSDILGTFSCHGIEPEYGADDEEIGVIQKINQDRGCVVYPFNRSRAQALFMVMDGHGSEGNRVSEHVMRKIVPLLELERLQDPPSCFKRACLQVDKELKETDMKFNISGTTLVAIYTLGLQYWVANVGDSRAVLARTVDRQLVAIDLSSDQKPSIPAERERILKCGGFVGDPDEDGLSSRVYIDEACTKVGLAVSRSIGDHIVKGVGVIAEPEVLEYTLQESDQFYILASDGVWEFMSSQEAVDIVSKHLSEGAEKACQVLIEAATCKWQEEEGDYRDDVS
jgi:protein phosphatase 2C family protein 2/3